MSGDRRISRWGGRVDSEDTMTFSALTSRRGRRVFAIAPPAPEPPQEQSPADRYGRPPRRHRAADAALFDLTPAGWVLTCGLDTSHYCGVRDSAAQQDSYMFDALRAAAWDTGWRMDSIGQWACPPCQMTPQWQTLRPIIHFHPGMTGAREFWLEVVAENEDFRAVRAARSRVVIIRPDGRRVAAKIVMGSAGRHAGTEAS